MKLASVSVLLLSFATLFAQSPNTLSHLDHVQKALAMFHQHDDAEAAGMLERCLDVTRSENNPVWEATILTLIGPVYQRLRRFTDAETSLNRSVAIWTSLDGARSRALVAPLANLGALYFDAAQYSRAEKVISRALEIVDAAPGPPGTKATLLTNLGSLYVAEHRYDLAEQIGQKTLSAFPSSDPERAWGYSILGVVYMQARRYSDAEKCMSEALEIWKAQFSAADPHIGYGLANLATLYSVSARPEKAEPLFQQAAALFEKGESDDAFVRQSLAEYADVEKRLGHKKEAKRVEKQLAAMNSMSAEAVLSRNIVDVSAFLGR